MLENMSGRIISLGVIAAVLVIFMVLSVSCAVCKVVQYPSGVSSNPSSPGINDILIRPESKEPNARPIVAPTTTSTATPEELKKITLYTGNDHGGQRHTMTFEPNQGCTVLPGHMVNRVKSLHTHGNCISLCDKTDCGGWCIQFQPGSPSHNRLRKLRFHNRAKSAVPCELTTS